MPYFETGTEVPFTAADKVNLNTKALQGQTIGVVGNQYIAANVATNIANALNAFTTQNLTDIAAYISTFLSNPVKYMKVSWNMGANNRELLWQIILPAATPQIMTGMQVSLPLCLIVAVVAEMLMGGYGLGGAMITASRFANSTGVFAGIVEIAVVGYVLVKAMAVLRRRLLIWHQEAHDPSTA